MRQLHMEETWGKYNDYYEVSTLGRVKSLNRIVNRPQGAYIKKEKILKLTQNVNGYNHIKAYKGDASFENLSIHRMVAIVFIPNPNNKPNINHINGIKDDNRVENLEWCTFSENSIHAYKYNLMRPRKGEENRTSILNNKAVFEIRSKHSTGKYTFPMLAKEYDVCVSNISCIVKRQTWKHI